MFQTKKGLSIILFFIVTFLLPLTLFGEDHQNYPVMPGLGKKVQMGDGNYLIYKFDKQPKLGMAIIKVEIFDRKDRKDTSMEIIGDAGMPSMRGAHDTGERPFALSNKGTYLLPVDIVMPGEWEIKLTVKKAGKVIFRGSHRFDV